MKEIKAFTIGDQVPSDAKFLSTNHSTGTFFYEVPIKEKKKKLATHEQSSLIHEIIDYLNEKTGSRFTAKSKSTCDHIRARLNEGRVIEDFKMVIDRKVDDWLEDPQMRQYLRPQTLFSPKFDGYLSARSNKEIEREAFADLDSLMGSDER